jgi:hypothetical protein
MQSDAVDYSALLQLRLLGKTASAKQAVEIWPIWVQQDNH